MFRAVICACGHMLVAFKAGVTWCMHCDRAPNHQREGCGRCDSLYAVRSHEG